MPCSVTMGYVLPLGISLFSSIKWEKPQPLPVLLRGFLRECAFIFSLLLWKMHCATGEQRGTASTPQHTQWFLSTWVSSIMFLSSTMGTGRKGTCPHSFPSTHFYYRLFIFSECFSSMGTWCYNFYHDNYHHNSCPHCDVEYTKRHYVATVQEECFYCGMVYPSERTRPFIGIWRINLS